METAMLTSDNGNAQDSDPSNGQISSSATRSPLKRQSAPDDDRDNAAASPSPVGDPRDPKDPIDQPPRKRAQMALSCSECKRRKIRCDRTVPCVACVKRGAAALCRWDNARIEPAPQPYALKEELYEVRQRLIALEQRLLQMSGSPVVAGGKEATQVSSAVSRNLSRNSPIPLSQVEASEKYQDAAEDAAVVLETAAFNPPINNGGPRSVISHEYWRGSMTTPHRGATPDTRANGASLIVAPGAREERSETGGDRLAMGGEPRLNAAASAAAAPGDQQEYTPARTSIQAPPREVGLDQGSLMMVTPLHLDSSLPQQQQHPKTQRLEALGGILSSLPTVRQSYYLATQYHDTVHWRSRILHWPSFQAELDHFWQMGVQGRHAEVDPLWLAVFFMVMALALDGSAVSADPGDPWTGYDRKDLCNLANKYHAMSIKALHLGDAMSVPRVRTIQAIMLFNQYFQTSTTWKRADLMLHWLAVAIRTAQLLGLHTLGNNPQVMPPDDPAWPPGKNAVKRHMALRLWMALQWADWMAASARFRCYMIHPAQCTSQLVDNVNDWELSPIDWRYTAHPPHVLTSVSFEIYKWRTASMLRTSFDRLITQADSFTYETVLELDRGYHEILDNLPKALRQAPSDAAACSSSTTPEDKTILWQRNLALKGIHSRIVRLHRPFLARAYTAGSKFASSRAQCLASARLVVDCHRNLRDLSTRGTFWFVYSHTLGAATVLFLDWFWAIDNHLPRAEVDAKAQTIYQVRDIFSTYSEISNASLRKVVESAFRIISDLISEANERQSARSGKPPIPFADVLRQVALRPHVLQSRQPVSVGQKAVERVLPADGSAVNLNGASFSPSSNVREQQQSHTPQSNQQQQQQQQFQSIIASASPNSVETAPSNMISSAQRDRSETGCNLQVPDEFPDSKFYSALGLHTQEGVGGAGGVVGDAAFANIWALNNDGSSPINADGSSPDKGQQDAPFLCMNIIDEFNQEEGQTGQTGQQHQINPGFTDNRELWQFLVD